MGLIGKIAKGLTGSVGGILGGVTSAAGGLMAAKARNKGYDQYIQMYQDRL